MPSWQLKCYQLKFLILLLCCTYCLAHTTNCWWDSLKDKCIPCTICDQEKNFIVLRPCQLHRDTICGTVNNLEIDWMILQRRNNNNNNNINNNELIDTNPSSSRQENLVWDWQAASFLMVVIACLIFFAAVAFVFIQHMMQWKKMEKRLDRELSAKLIAKLAENEKSGSFLIENPIKSSTGNGKSLRVHCIILDPFLVEKSSIKNVESECRHYVEGI